MSEPLKSYFDQYGWAYEEERPDYFRTGFHGAGTYFDIHVRSLREWVFFYINPFVSPMDPVEHQGNFFHSLLEANHQMNLAKFCLDSRGNVSLCVEAPRKELDYTYFEDAIGAMSHYAELYFPLFQEQIADQKDDGAA